MRQDATLAAIAAIARGNDDTRTSWLRMRLEAPPLLVAIIERFVGAQAVRDEPA
jgi:hypothetical protein